MQKLLNIDYGISTYRFGWFKITEIEPIIESQELVIFLMDELGKPDAKTLSCLLDDERRIAISKVALLPAAYYVDKSQPYHHVVCSAKPEPAHDARFKCRFNVRQEDMQYFYPSDFETAIKCFLDRIKNVRTNGLKVSKTITGVRHTDLFTFSN